MTIEPGGGIVSPLIVIDSIADLPGPGEDVPPEVAAALEWVRPGVLHPDVTRCGPAMCEWTRGDSNP